VNHLDTCPKARALTAWNAATVLVNERGNTLIKHCYTLLYM